MSYVKTPCGVIMHVDNHKKAVERARDFPGLMLMLVPSEPVEVLFPMQELASSGGPYRAPDKVVTPSKPMWDLCDYLNDFVSRCYERFGKRVITEITMDYEVAISAFGEAFAESTGIFSDTFRIDTPVGPITIRKSKKKSCLSG